MLARRLIQRAVSRRVGHRPALYKRHFFYFAGRPEAVPYIRPLGRNVQGRYHCSALSVTFGDSSPEGGAKACRNACIGAFLPLPSGEVAARSADGEGV